MRLFSKILYTLLILGLIPLLIYGIYTTKSIRDLSTSVLEESRQLGFLTLRECIESMNRLREKFIQQKAEDVAKQVEIYLKINPKTLKALQKDPYFQSIAVQPVGETGYTALTNMKTAICVFHKQPNIVNLNLQTLEAKLPDFWKIMKLSLSGKSSSGYYDWIEPNSTTRKKYMYITPIKAATTDGVEMTVAATTYIDEFSRPIYIVRNKMINTIENSTEQMEYSLKRLQETGWTLLFATGVLIAVVSYLLAKYITIPIKQLTETAERISKGDLSETEVKVKSRDEIGQLASSFTRIAASLKILLIQEEKKKDE